MKPLVLGLLSLFGFWIPAVAQTLNLPARSKDAVSGSQFSERIKSLELQQREKLIFAEATQGNVPEFFRKLCPVVFTNVSGTTTNIALIFVTPEYLAIGSDEDFFLAPMTPFTAQKIADAAGCTLPTRKMVSQIYSQARVKLPPSPLPPNASMITAPVFQKHNALITTQRATFLDHAPLGALTAGHKKDVVISARLAESPGKVAIFGWHQTNGVPIQPLFLGHSASWVDYSHGIRLVQKNMMLNGKPSTVAEVLADSTLAELLSDEGVLRQASYRFNQFPSLPIHTNTPVLGQFQNSSSFNEQTMLMQLDHEVRVLINAPEMLDAPKKLKLVFYALPNGNTIEQTIGRRTTTNEDWHFNIQHIGAQTRFVRAQLTNENVMVAYVENSLKTWPAWRKKFGDKAVLEIVEKVAGRFEALEPKIILSGHSGGGSFVFGYLNSLEKIPDEVERIAFLDATYAYETARHRDKLAAWLKTSSPHFLTVLAYHDDVALLQGKPFVSAAGGTWGRSHLMKKDLEDFFKFSGHILPDFQNYTALDGRVNFFLKENPDKKILHTLQVEKNGFIHSLLSGTPLENTGYEYFGAPAYLPWIQN
ncbi:MAG: hypothetical protein ABI042_14470 [Verrucomicrobiota bacterium]